MDELWIPQVKLFSVHEKWGNLAKGEVCDLKRWSWMTGFLQQMDASPHLSLNFTPIEKTYNRGSNPSWWDAMVGDSDSILLIPPAGGK